MQIKNKTIRRGYKLLLLKKHYQLIHLLEPKITFFLEDTHFFYLLARAYFLTGDTDNAEIYTKRGLKVDSSFLDLQLLLATIHFKRRNVAKSLKIWLDIIGNYPRNKSASRGLEKIRKLEDEEALFLFTRSSKVDRLLPPVPGRLSLWSGLLFKFILLAFVFVALAWGVRFYLLPRIGFASPPRNPEAAISLKDIPRDSYLLKSNGEEVQYILNEKEVADTVRSINKYFEEKRDNYAQKEINRLHLSNASDDIKRRAAEFSSLLTPPEMPTFYDNFTYKEVQNEPELYADCYVVWKGRIANPETDGEKSQFTLLVDYTDKKIFSGTVTVFLDFYIDPLLIANVEVLGKVVIDKSDGVIVLHGMTVRPL